jgi:hypothetical protein
LSEDHSTRSRANFQYAQAGSARLGKGWRKQHCEVVKKKLWESFFRVWGEQGLKGRAVCLMATYQMRVIKISATPAPPLAHSHRFTQSI